MRLVIKIIKNSLFISLIGLSLPLNVAAQSSSNNYRLEESFFGTGGEVDSSSNNYRSRQSAGALGVGNASSTNYDSAFGNITPEEPFLEMTVTGGTLDLGNLDPNTTAYGSPVGGGCNCSFTVRTYNSSEYSVISVSQPPVNESGDYLTAKATQAAASGSANTEEFGMNLVANTSPGTFGANLVNVPDNSFADAKIATGYETANQFKWGVGDVIAQSQATAGNPAVGQTNYTISYIAKPNNVTAAGNYSLRHVLVVVPVY